MLTYLIAAGVISSVVYYVFVLDTVSTDLLEGKYVVITGASRGIGEELAYHYAKYGANVLITARTENNLIQVVDKCKKLAPFHSKILYHVADMSRMEEADTFFKTIEKDFGKLDILVLNHILKHPLGPWIGTSENFTLFDQIMDVNFKSYIHLASSGLPLLKESRGQIVVLNSIVAKIGQPYLAAYSAAKSALPGFFDSLRLEFDLRHVPISITQVTLGLIGTKTALRNLENFGLHRILNMQQAADPGITADYIITSSLSRPKQIYYPYIGCVTMTMVQSVFPELVYHLLRYMYYT